MMKKRKNSVKKYTSISEAASSGEKIVNCDDEESLVPSKGDALPNVDPEERPSNGKQSPEVCDGVENEEETPAILTDDVDDATRLDREGSETHPAQSIAHFESEEDVTCNLTDGDTFTLDSERVEDEENGNNNNDLSVEEEKLHMEDTDPISTPNKETGSYYASSGDDEAC
jgi:hypothetical protein